MLCLLIFLIILDLEDYIANLEEHWHRCEIPQVDWIFSLGTRLTGSVESLFSEVREISDDYTEVKGKLLKAAGYTPKLAAAKFFTVKLEDLKGLSADQILHKGRQYLRRMCAPCKVGEGAEYGILKGWVYNVLPKRAKTIIIDHRAISSMEELTEALRDLRAVEGELKESFGGLAKRQFTDFSRDKKGACFKCGKYDYKAADCSEGRVHFQPKAEGQVDCKVTCFSCG